MASKKQSLNIEPAVWGDGEKEQTHFGVSGVLCVSHTADRTRPALTELCLLGLMDGKMGDRWSDGFEQCVLLGSGRKQF